MKKVDDRVRMGRLKALHLNDSMFAAGAHRDRHANTVSIKVLVQENEAKYVEHLFSVLFSGLIGVEAFRHLINDPRTDNLPMILETAGPEKPAIDLLFSLHEKSKTS